MSRNFKIKPSPPIVLTPKKQNREVDFKALVLSSAPSLKKAKVCALLDLFDANLTLLDNLSVSRFVAIFMALAGEAKVPHAAWAHINQKLSIHNINLTQVIVMIVKNKNVDEPLANKILTKIKIKKNGNKMLDQFIEYKYVTTKTIDDLMNLPQEIKNVESCLSSAQQKYELESSLEIKSPTTQKPKKGILIKI